MQNIYPVVLTRGHQGFQPSSQPPRIGYGFTRDKPTVVVSQHPQIVPLVPYRDVDSYPLSTPAVLSASAPLHMILDDDGQERQTRAFPVVLLLCPSNDDCFRPLGARAQSHRSNCSRDPPALEPSSPQRSHLRPWPHKASPVRRHPCRDHSQIHDFCFTVDAFKRPCARLCKPPDPSSLLSLSRPATTWSPLPDSGHPNLQLSFY